MHIGNRFWKVAAVIAIITCAGAIAATVGINIYQHYTFEGQDKDGVYHFSGKGAVELENGMVHTYTTSVSVSGAEDMDVEQYTKDLEEIELLRQQDDRELARVIETYVNGNFHRTFSFNYTLSDGRVSNMGENDPELWKPRSPEQIEQDKIEIALLREIDERRLVRVIETQVGDEVFREYKYRYVLSDGYVHYEGESDTEQIGLESILTSEQNEELWSLRGLEEGTYLGCEDMEVQGRILAFETYVFTLSDGTEVIHSVGDPKGIEKIQLTEEDREEFSNLRDAGEYTSLDSEIKEFRGQMFLFEPQLYILSDGAEFIWSVGKPIED